MTFEGGFIVIFAFLFGVPLLLGLARLVGWLTGTNAKPIWLVLLLAIALPIAGTFYLDFAGAIKPVRIVHKKEEVKVNYNGNWNRVITLGVEYDTPGKTLPTRFSLGCDAPTFDEIQMGQSVEVRLLDFGGVFKFARLKNRSTISILAGLFPRQPGGPWREGTAIATDVTHITQYSGYKSEYEYRWPYDVVELSFVPAGKTQAVVAVDSVEVASVPNIKVGQSVPITWPIDNPRVAHIVGGRPGAPWTNWLYALAETLAIGAAFIAGILLLSFLFKRRRERRKPPAAI